MKTSTLITTVCLCLTATFVLPRETNAQAGGAGIVEEISGNAYWRQNPNDRPERLDPKSDTARRLYPGEQVRCERGGSLRLRLGRALKVIKPSAWFTVPQSVSSGPSPVQQMLDAYGDPGGRNMRGGSLQVFSPSDHGVTAPEPFVIRWVSTAVGCTLSLKIRDIRGATIWRQDDVDGSSGSLHSSAAEQALADYRVKFGQGPLNLRVADSCRRSETPVSFTLLSIKSEQALKNELAFWDKDDGSLLPHLGRASVYSRYRMFPQAADEYEAALKAAPNSHHLLTRTILAHRATGNFNRSEELEKSLLIGTSVP